MQNLLVTGGAGFIGSNFIRYVLASNPDVKLVVNLDALTYAGNTENLRGLPMSKKYIFNNGSINNAGLVDNILNEFAIDTVINFAAETHVDRSINSASPFMQTNAMGTLCLLESACRAWLKRKTVSREKVRFHHISTDEVYGSLSPGEPPFSEITAYSPNSPYAASKAASDHLVRAFGNTYGLPITISNCSNNYGPYQHPEKLIPIVILNAVQGQPIPIYGDGLQVRDWLHVDDHCRAIALILESGTPGETYNVGGDVQVTNLELVKKICAILDDKRPRINSDPHASLIQFVVDRPGHDRRYAINIEKIANSLGWRPRHSLDEGISATVSWYMENMDWVDAIQSKPDYQNWIRKNYGMRRSN